MCGVHADAMGKNRLAMGNIDNLEKPEVLNEFEGFLMVALRVLVPLWRSGTRLIVGFPRSIALSLNSCGVALLVIFGSQRVSRFFVPTA